MARPIAVRRNIKEKNCHDQIHDDGDGDLYNCKYLNSGAALIIGRPQIPNNHDLLKGSSHKRVNLVFSNLRQSSVSGSSAARTPRNCFTDLGARGLTLSLSRPRPFISFSFPHTQVSMVKTNM